MSKETYIIAEIGVNHNGSMDYAFKLIDKAVKAKANAVKFQTFKTENLVTKESKQADYQIINIGTETSQYEMLKELELTNHQFKKLKKYCDDKNIEFLSTPFDEESVDFLINEIGVSRLKISSGELNNTPFLHYVATKQKPIILSTGMATIDEIHESLSYIAYGLAKPKEPVQIENVKIFYETKEAKTTLKRYVTILQCTSEYPTEFSNVNLRSMDYLKEELELNIGLSDHSVGIHVPIAAVAKEAVIIEKHFTLSRDLPGPDHNSSLEPDELSLMVEAIRNIEKSLGENAKKPTLSELKTRKVVRRSLVAKSEIKIGEKFTKNNLSTKRIGNGLPPAYYWSLLGKIANKSYEKDDLINE